MTTTIPINANFSPQGFYSHRIIFIPHAGGRGGTVLIEEQRPGSGDPHTIHTKTLVSANIAGPVLVAHHDLPNAPKELNLWEAHGGRFAVRVRFVNDAAPLTWLLDSNGAAHLQPPPVALGEAAQTPKVPFEETYPGETDLETQIRATVTKWIESETAKARERMLNFVISELKKQLTNE